jgi:hypothetical protein
MLRRGFFKRTFSGFLALLAPRFAARLANAQALPADSERAMRELAAVVLPSSLGKAGTDKAAVAFVQWVRDYKPGAEIASGYGYPRTQIIGPSPAALYPDQLRQLNFAQLDAPAKRAAVEKAIAEAKVDRIPQRPNGKHVASDLLAFFYNSADGEDFLYGVAIKRDDCRGLADSAKRPAKITG